MKSKIFRITWQGSLYDPDSVSSIENLEEIVSIVNSRDCVVLDLASSAHDFHESWFQQLSDKVLYEDLLSHCDRVFKLLARIASSPAKWVSLFSGDCLGSWWDLSLACHVRVGLDPYAKVGFPEFQIDLVPPLSSGLISEVSMYSNFDVARKNAIMQVKEAHALGVVTNILRGSRWLQKPNLELLVTWIEQLPRTGSAFRSLDKKTILSSTPDLLGLLEDRSSLADRRKQISKSFLSGFSLKNERSHQNMALAMSNVRAGAVARFFFSSYLSWLGRRISRYQAGERLNWVSNLPSVVVIDCNDGVPPQSLFSLLHSRKIKILLIAKSELVLKERVESILSRSSKSGITKSDVLESWRGSVDWAVLGQKSVESFVLKFLPNDFFQIYFANELLVSRFRMSGNYGQSAVGWCEDVQLQNASSRGIDERLHTAKEIADLLTSGSLRVDQWPFDIPLSVSLRFLLLDEMCRLGISGEWPDIVDQTKLLASSGWGFAGDVPQWDSMLRSFRKNEVLSQSLAHLGAFRPNHLWRASIVEEKDVLLPKKSVSRLDVSGPRLTRYSQAFAIKVRDVLLGQKLAKSDVEADLFLTLSWGYPALEPVPSAVIKSNGQGWAEFWLARCPVGRAVVI